MVRPERLKLTHVAIRKDGIVYSLPAPNRHHHILWILAERKGLPNVPSVADESMLVETPNAGEDSQGFLDESGRYLNRRQAEVNAFLFNQIKNGKLIGSVLTSEDLW
jgi:hypothetical protein